MKTAEYGAGKYQKHKQRVGRLISCHATIWISDAAKEAQRVGVFIIIASW